MKQTVYIKKMRESALLPQYATEGAAAVDLVACVEEPFTLQPGERKLIPTGVAISIPQNTVAVLSARSGLSAKKGITAVNGIGVIDSDYRGEIFFSAINLSKEAYTVTPGERVAQLMLLPLYTMSLLETDTLDKTARGEGGFGSTGL